MRVRTWHVLATLAILACVYAVNFLNALEHEEFGSGAFGDSFGASNALFAGSALIFLVLAFLSQREELRIVRDERNDTKKLLEGQKKITEQQSDLLSKQSFEQSFFSLVRLISEERRDLDRYISLDSSMKIISSATSYSKNRLSEKKTFSEGDIPPRVEECGNVCRLFLTTYGLLRRSGIKRSETLVYYSTLHALMDSDLAHNFILLSRIWASGDPRVAPAIKELQIISFIDPVHREFCRQIEEEIDGEWKKNFNSEEIEAILGKLD